MANKPDKYGIKFWLLVDVKNHFCVNQLPYLGKDNERGSEPVGQYVVKKLMEPFKHSGYNVTADNFFSSAPLAKQLLQQKITYLGTVRSSSRSLPPSVIANNLQMHQSEFYKAGDVLFARYQCKTHESVFILSTIHFSPRISEESIKRKPKMVLTYNQTKVGVDSLDQMVRLYSTKAASRRWPVCVFYDLLDKAVLNAHVLYQEAIGPITRKKFILELAKQLCEPLQACKKARHDQLISEVQVKRKRITCYLTNCENKTYNFCDSCNKAFCGKHGQKRKVELLKCHNC
jgi:hypothetical protein